MPSIPGMIADVSYGDADEPLRNWREVMPDDDDDSDELTPGQREALVGVLGFDPRESADEGELNAALDDDAETFADYDESKPTTPRTFSDSPPDPAANGFVRNRYGFRSRSGHVPAGQGWSRRNDAGVWENYSHDEAVNLIAGNRG